MARGTTAACVIVIFMLAFSAAHAQLAAGIGLEAPAKKALLAPLPPLREQNGVRYLRGGGGEEARSAMASAARAFNLRLQFAAGPGRRLIREVRVLVQDPEGEVVFDLPDAGPLLFIDLPRGRYLVRAEYGGVLRARAVVVGDHSGVRAVFQWPETEAKG